MPASSRADPAAASVAPPRPEEEEEEAEKPRQNRARPSASTRAIAGNLPQAPHGARAGRGGQDSSLRTDRDPGAAHGLGLLEEGSGQVPPKLCTRQGADHG